MDKEKVGRRIKAIRLQAGQNQETFGKFFTPSVSKGAVSRWESGDTVPNAKRLKKIADLGGVSVDFLLNGRPKDRKDRIQDLMMEQKLSAEQVADKSRIDVDTVNKYKFGRLVPTVEDWNTLAKIFGVSISYLKGDTRDRNGVMVGTDYTFEDFASLMGITEDEIEELSESDRQKVARIRFMADSMLSFICEELGGANSSKVLRRSSQKWLDNIYNMFSVWNWIILGDEKHSAKHQTIDGINETTDKYLKQLMDFAVSIGAAEKPESDK